MVGKLADRRDDVAEAARCMRSVAWQLGTTRRKKKKDNSVEKKKKSLLGSTVIVVTVLVSPSDWRVINSANLDKLSDGGARLVSHPQCWRAL